MRQPLTRELLDRLFEEIAREAPKKGRFKVMVTGGGTAVAMGWRDGTIDADVAADRDEVFRNIQAIILRLNINVEFAKPTDFVPGLPRYDSRHIFIKTINNVSFFHFDPYTQILSKIVRGFEKDLTDARNFLSSGLVDAEKLEKLITDLPDSAFEKYPSLLPSAVRVAIREYLGCC